jgi:hypothetical protein
MTPVDFNLNLIMLHRSDMHYRYPFAGYATNFQPAVILQEQHKVNFSATFNPVLVATTKPCFLPDVTQDTCGTVQSSEPALRFSSVVRRFAVRAGYKRKASLASRSLFISFIRAALLAVGSSLGMQFGGGRGKAKKTRLTNLFSVVWRWWS